MRSTDVPAVSSLLVWPGVNQRPEVTGTIWAFSGGWSLTLRSLNSKEEAITPVRLSVIQFIVAIQAALTLLGGCTYHPLTEPTVLETKKVVVQPDERAEDEKADPAPLKNNEVVDAQRASRKPLALPPMPIDEALHLEQAAPIMIRLPQVP